MELRILGPLEALDGDRPVPLGGKKPRTLLALLILRRGDVVSIDEIVEALWGEAAPKTAEHSIQVYVSDLRRARRGPAPYRSAPFHPFRKRDRYGARRPHARCAEGGLAGSEFVARRGNEGYLGGGVRTAGRDS